jgi:hypothetical protein
MSREQTKEIKEGVCDDAYPLFVSRIAGVFPQASNGERSIRVLAIFDDAK